MSTDRTDLEQADSVEVMHGIVTKPGRSGAFAPPSVHEIFTRVSDAVSYAMAAQMFEQFMADWREDPYGFKHMARVSVGIRDDEYRKRYECYRLNEALKVTGHAGLISTDDGASAGTSVPGTCKHMGTAVHTLKGPKVSLRTLPARDKDA